MWNMMFNFLSVLIARVYITLKVLQQYLASPTVDVPTISRNTKLNKQLCPQNFEYERRVRGGVFRNLQNV